MGGWPLRSYTAPNQQTIASCLGLASFVSVRDQESAAILREINPSLNPHIAPDCVFLLPDLLPPYKVSELISPAVRQVVQDAGEFSAFNAILVTDKPIAMS